MITPEEAENIAASLWSQVEEHAANPAISQLDLDLFVESAAGFEIAALGYPRDAWWILTRCAASQRACGHLGRACSVARLRGIVEAML